MGFKYNNFLQQIIYFVNEIYFGWLWFALDKKKN